MMGQSHLVASVCGSVLVHTGLQALVQDDYFGKFSFVSNSVDIIYNTLFGFSANPMIALGVGSGLMFLGTLMPDMDNPNSMLGRYVHIPVGHRTWLHSIYPILLLMVAAYFFTPLWWMVWGYFLHLFWDSPSIMGIAWIRPVTGYRTYPSGAKVKKNHWIKLYRANDLSEKVFVGAILLFTALAVGFGYYAKIYSFM